MSVWLQKFRLAILDRLPRRDSRSVARYNTQSPFLNCVSCHFVLTQDYGFWGYVVLSKTRIFLVIPL